MHVKLHSSINSGCSALPAQFLQHALGIVASASCLYQLTKLLAAELLGSRQLQQVCGCGPALSAHVNGVQQQSVYAVCWKGLGCRKAGKGINVRCHFPYLATVALLLQHSQIQQLCHGRKICRQGETHAHASEHLVQPR